MKKIYLALFALTLLILTACTSEKEEKPVVSDKKEEKEVVRFALDWTPNTNHTGLYTALENGYFEEEGLDVEIIMPGEVGAEQLIAANKAEFGVSFQTELTEARMQELPIVSLAAILQHNTGGYASVKSKGITTPKDFEGKTYGGYGGAAEQAFLKTIMDEAGADFDKVEYINLGAADLLTALERDIDFASIFYAWTGIEGEIRDIELDVQFYKDNYNLLDIYSPVIATSEKMIASKPETVEAFMRALSKGYEFAIEKPEEAANILLKQVPDLDEDLVHASQQWISPRYQDDAERWGDQQLHIWEDYSAWLTEKEIIDEGFEPEKAFTTEFLPN